MKLYFGYLIYNYQNTNTKILRFMKYVIDLEKNTKCTKYSQISFLIYN